MEQGWLGRAEEWRREMAAAFLLGAFIGLIGPFGTFLFGPTVLRVAYWTAMFMLGQLIFGVGMRFARQVGLRLDQPGWFVTPIAVAILCLPVSLVCAISDTSLWPRAAHYMRPYDWYAQVLLVSLPLNLLLIRLRGQWGGTRPDMGAAPPVMADDLRARLPARLGGRVVCLQMEDHYVRVHTDQGSELVHMPLKSALAALNDVEGLQTHRSWWVARDAVSEIVPSGRNIRLRLVNGMIIPVARSSVARLKQAGWLGETVI